MDELGELEKRHDDLVRQNVRVIAVSNDNKGDAQETQSAFPHLLIVADTQQKFANAVKVIHSGAGPGGTDTNAPTTFLLDGDGTIRWTYRPPNLAVRLTPAEVFAAIEKSFP